ncbi:unnamed protein product [Rangifer tarandus platyrhynchus]|uniref:Uncharacterized protein n=1 Tax=Rangifer tarandus platyrhynchus TaxID=3082113 RepID=A0ABN8ZMI4_RANTA|nr:unnamed protein product [Rangifer tarandus platyrhynchus]
MAPWAPDRRGPPPGSARGAGVLGGEPLGSLGSAPAASQTCLVASPLGAYVPSDKTTCVLPTAVQALAPTQPPGAGGAPSVAPRDDGRCAGAERGSCRRTPRGRSEKKAGDAPSSAAGPCRWEGRTSVTRAQGQGEGTRPGLGAPRPRRGEDLDRRSGTEFGSGPRTSSPRRTPPRSVHGAALAATLPQRGPGGGRAHRRPSSAVGRKTWRSGLQGRRGGSWVSPGR